MFSNSLAGSSNIIIHGGSFNHVVRESVSNGK